MQSAENQPAHFVGKGGVFPRSGRNGFFSCDSVPEKIVAYPDEKFLFVFFCERFVHVGEQTQRRVQKIGVDIFEMMASDEFIRIVEGLKDGKAVPVLLRGQLSGVSLPVVVEGAVSDGNCFRRHQSREEKGEVLRHFHGRVKADVVPFKHGTAVNLVPDGIVQKKELGKGLQRGMICFRPFGTSGDQDIFRFIKIIISALNEIG